MIADAIGPGLLYAAVAVGALCYAMWEYHKEGR